MIPVSSSTADGCALKQPAGSNILCFACAAAIALVTSLPVLNIISIIATTGADNLSNDYLHYTGMVGQVLSGSYNWLNYFQDTFYRTHSVALPVLVHLIDARFFHFNAYVELYFGVALAAGRLWLWQSMLAGTLSGKLKYCLWPALSLIIFSNSQISVFTFGDAAVTIELSLFGFSAGLWAVTRENQNRWSMAAMAAGGLIASFSWGNGILTWFVFLAGLVLSKCRKPLPYIVWASGLCLSLLPYIFGLLLPKLAGSAADRVGTSIVSLCNWRFIVNCLGWPFAADIGRHAESLPAARAVGWTGLVTWLAGSALLWLKRKDGIGRACLPGSLLITHGLLSVWQISVFRSLLAPWYTAVAMSFWAGLVGLAFVLAQNCLDNREAHCPSRPLLSKATWLWCLFVGSFLVTVYLLSNLSFEDKSDMLFSRSPASASALRNYRTAPTYAEKYLFQWGVGNPQLLPILAEPLERHRLSSFAPRQQWALQGDFLLDNVTVARGPAPAETFWTAGTGQADRLPFDHYRHLNLFIPAQASVSWRVELPPDTQEAVLRSAARAGSPTSRAGAEQESTGGVFLKRQGASDELVFSFRPGRGNGAWREFQVPLKAFKGKVLTIKFASGSGLKDASVVYRYPVIDLIRRADNTQMEPVVIRPSNTDLSESLPACTDRDYRFDTDSANSWDISGMTSLGRTGADKSCWKVTGSPTMTYRGSLNLDLSAYHHFLIRLAATPDIQPRALTVEMAVAGRRLPLSFQIPLLADGKAHSYSYDLKLLEAGSLQKITGLKIILPSPAQAKGPEQIETFEARLVAVEPDKNPP